MDPTDLANRWIALQYADKNAPDYDHYFRAFEEVDALTDDHPAEAWDFVMTVVARAGSEFIGANLAAGPVEDLLMRHPEATMQRIERDVATSPMLAKILYYVWQNNLPSDLWRRLLEARESHGSVA